MTVKCTHPPRDSLEVEPIKMVSPHKGENRSVPIKLNFKLKR